MKQKIKNSGRWALKSLIVVLLVLTAAPVWAITLDEARKQGFVGEKPDGLIAAVISNPSTEVRSLISEVNSARLSSYRQLATKDSAPVQAVQAIAGEKLTQMARQRGWYYMDGRGGWQR